MSTGPVMLDLEGPALGPRERERLAGDGVCGVILFGRNFESREQLAALVADVHAVREPRLLVAVDHEGGRVQRFREGFTQLPPAAAYGAVYDRDPEAAARLAEAGGRVMAAELRGIGVDLSFAPVLDLGTGASEVIGDRAFHHDPDAVTRLARAFVAGMRWAGMPAVGKHFPGHGSVEGDSHLVLPVDRRDLETIRLADLVPFERLARDGLPAMMPAHVLFPEIDDRPAGFSRRWIEGVLRGELGFAGAVFSDDLSMAGADVAGDPIARARAALGAGCDVALVCNAPRAAAAVADALAGDRDPVRRSRVARLHGGPPAERDPDARAAILERDRAAIRPLLPEPELDLGDDSVL